MGLRVPHLSAYGKAWLESICARVVCRSWFYFAFGDVQSYAVNTETEVDCDAMRLQQGDAVCRKISGANVVVVGRFVGARYSRKWGRGLNNFTRRNCTSPSN